MAPTICKECGNIVNPTAKACPHCGARAKSGGHARTIILVALVIVSVASWYMFRRTQAPDTIVRIEGTSGDNKQDAPVLNKMAQDEMIQNEPVQRAAEGVRILRKTMHNPDNFKLDRAVVMSGTGTVCYQFRTGDAQGGMVRGQAVFSGDAESPYTNEMHGFSRLWNMECAGKNGTDAATEIRRIAP